MSEETPLLNVSVCSHGKKNDGAYSTVPEGSRFYFPACGREHVATRDLYGIDPRWVEEQERMRVMRERAAKARAARWEN